MTRRTTKTHSAMTRHEARALIRRALGKDLHWVTGQGFAWFQAKLLPAAVRLRADAAKGSGRKWAAEAECLLGDVYDLSFNANRAAARAYQRTLRLEPQHAWAQSELGRAYYNMGQFSKAKGAWKKALNLAPGNEYVLRDLKDLEEDIRYRRKPLDRPDDPLVRACEALARLRPRRALEITNGVSTIPAKLIRARAFGMLKDIESYLRTWETIASRRGTVAMGYEDWFFLPDEVWDHPRFWTATLRIGDRWRDGTYPLDETFPDRGKWPKHNSKAHRHRFQRRWRLLSQLHLARTSGDVKTALSLSKRNPTWKFAREVVRLLERRLKPHARRA